MSCPYLEKDVFFGSLCTARWEKTRISREYEHEKCEGDYYSCKFYKEWTGR